MGTFVREKVLCYCETRKLFHNVSRFTCKKRDSSLKPLERSCVFEEVDCEAEYQS